MTYQNFVNQTIDTIKPNFSINTDFRQEAIMKNNGVILNALIISEPECNVFPTIYLDGFYDRAENGEDISTICGDILELYNTNKVDEKLDISALSDFSYIKSRVVYRLINREKNSKLLEDIPWVPYLDLATIFCIYFDSPKDIYAGSIIHNTNLSNWNTDVKELFALAEKNTSRLLPVCLKSMPEFLNDIAGEIISCDIEPSQMLYILTNDQRTHGASAMLYKNIIRDLASKLNQDLFILPSSIHEVMLLPCDFAVSAESISSLIKEVNETQVSVDEYLSDTLYTYHLDRDEITYGK